MCASFYFEGKPQCFHWSKFASVEWWLPCLDLFGPHTERSSEQLLRSHNQKLLCSASVFKSSFHFKVCNAEGFSGAAVWLFQWNPGTRFSPGIWKLHPTCEHAATRSAYLINLSLNEEEARDKRSWSGNRLLVNCLITCEPLKCESVYKNGCNSSAFNAMILLNLLNYSWRSGLTSGLFHFKSIVHRAKSFSNQKLKDLTVNILFLKVSTGFKWIVCQINTEKVFYQIVLVLSTNRGSC